MGKKKFKKFARKNLPFGRLIFGKGKKAAVPVVEEEEEEEEEVLGEPAGMKHGGIVRGAAASDKAKRGAGAVATSRPWSNRA